MRTIRIGLVILGTGAVATIAACIWLVVLGYRADAGTPVAEWDGWIQLAAALAVATAGATTSIIGALRRHARHTNQ